MSIKIYGSAILGGGTLYWYDLTGTPTTLSGYGITDAAPKTLETFVGSHSALWASGASASAAAVAAANSYTDSAVADKATTGSVASVSADTLSQANAYTDSAVAGKATSASVAAASAAAVASANSYTDSAVSDKATVSSVNSSVAAASAAAVTSANSYTDSAVANKATVSTVAAASAAAVASANSYADSNFIPAAGGTITGSLSVMGNLTYIDTSVAVTSAMYIDTASSETALRVTQSGTGDVIRVEDSANPDVTPFIVKSDGLVGIGTEAPNEKLTVVGNVSATAFYGSGSNLTGVAPSSLTTFVNSNSAGWVNGNQAYTAVNSNSANWNTAYTNSQSNAGVNTWVQSNSANSTFTSVAADAHKATSSTVNAQVGTSYVLVAGDNGKIVTMSNSSASTLSIPSGLGAGFSCMIVQLGSGQVTLSAGSGVTMNSYGSLTKIAGQHAGASLFAYSANTFNLNGNLA